MLHALIILFIVKCVVADTPASLTTTAASSSSYVQLFTTIGDSNTDAGDAAYALQSYSKLSDGKIPNATYYRDGRFNNGKVWTDYLLDEVADLEVQSFAVGFGTACTANRNPDMPETYPASGQQQAQNLVAHLKDKKSQLPQNRAVVIWIGVNDLGFAALPTAEQPLPTLLTDTDSVLNSVLRCVSGIIQELLNAGETRIIIFGVQPPKGPLVTDLLVNYPGVEPLLEGITIKYNDMLQARIESLQSDSADDANATLYYFDTYTPLLAAINGTAPGLGVSNLTAPCLPALYGDALSGRIILSSAPCQDPDEYVFYDQVHFTSVIHKKVIANAFREFLIKQQLISNSTTTNGTSTGNNSSTGPSFTAPSNSTAGGNTTQASAAARGIRCTGLNVLLLLPVVWAVVALVVSLDVTPAWV